MNFDDPELKKEEEDADDYVMIIRNSQNTKIIKYLVDIHAISIAAKLGMVN